MKFTGLLRTYKQEIYASSQLLLQMHSVKVIPAPNHMAFNVRISKTETVIIKTTITISRILSAQYNFLLTSSLVPLAALGLTRSLITNSIRARRLSSYWKLEKSIIRYLSSLAVLPFSFPTCCHTIGLIQSSYKYSARHKAISDSIINKRCGHPSTCVSSYRKGPP